MNNVVHIPCDCPECVKNQERLNIFKKLTPFIDRKVNELRIKNDLGMGGSVDKIEYEELKKLLPNVLGDIK